MRTNIVLNDDLVREAMKYCRAPSKRALVEEALRTLIATKAAQERVAGYQDRTQALDRKLTGIVLRESPHRVLRTARERS